MLGRLGMTIDEAIEQYTAIVAAIFSKKDRKAAFKSEAFKTSTLERKMQDLVASKAPGERMIASMSANTAGGSEGRAFVYAMPTCNMAHPKRFRTYAARANAGPERVIWQAARATTATPASFKPVAIYAAPGHAPQPFVDGGLRCNIPVREVMDEAGAAFGGEARLDCIVSIGAGYAAVNGIEARRARQQPNALERLLLVGLVKTLTGTATDCEKKAQSVARQFRQLLHRY
jgi:predicted acylesterase/phospholipase RssA